MLHAEYAEMTSTVESQLRAQLKDLQQKLGDLHCTDVNALRRAYTSLSQHVKHIITLMAQIDTQLLTPEYVSQEAVQQRIQVMLALVDSHKLGG
ncbi:uncharacterized protein HaLaN_15937, partial [Haematococcus lacustris]